MQEIEHQVLENKQGNPVQVRVHDLKKMKLEEIVEHCKAYPSQQNIQPEVKSRQVNIGKRSLYRVITPVMNVA